MNERPNLVLVPGTLCDAGLWRHQSAHLAEVAEVAVAVHTGQDDMAGIAESILAAAPPRFSLAGLSMGGFICFEIMRRAPERVERLALLDTSARPDTPDQAVRRRDLVALAERGNFKGVTRRMLPLFVHPDRIGDEQLVGEVMAMGLRVGLAAYLRQQSANAGRADSRPTLARIGCPTLVVCGRQDSLLPLEHSAEIAAGIAGAKLVVIEDCGHLPSMERPQATTALLRYWLTG